MGNNILKYANVLLITAIIATLILSIALVVPNVGAKTAHVENTTINTTTSTAGPTTTILFTTLPTANATASGGFLNSKPITFKYSGNYTCSPDANALLGNGSAVENSIKFTNCEVGAAGNNTGQLPLWITVPAYAGLSIFGVPSLGASPQGFPMYANSVILTECGGGGSPSACPDHPTYLYSPVFTAVEQHLGITTGVLGLPEGVLTTPAHSHIVNSNASGANVDWYVISVLVLDPNIMPNATTGKCTQVVASNLSNSTANCLTSLAALQRALVTSSSDVHSVNANNPIYQTLAGNSVINLQVLVPGDTVVTELQGDNTNVAIPFAVNESNYYNSSQFRPTTTVNTTTIPPTTTVNQTTNTTVAPTTVAQQSSGGSSNTLLYVGIVVVIILILLAAWAMMRKK
jgi:hypothetical protein